jgi:PKD repeat protein
MICHMPTVFSTIFKNVTTGTVLALLVAATASLSGCTPDSKSESLGALPSASFTVSPVSGKANTFVATAGTNNIFQWYWNAGDGSSSALGGSSDTLFYPLAGNYRVTLTAFGHGGYDTTSQIVEVDSNAPLVNVLVNPSLTTDSDWTILNTGATITTINFTPQGLNLSNSGASANTNGGIYQAVQVQAGITYTFSATVTTPGSTNTWVEFYFGTTVPTQGSDYTDNKLWSLNTYSGCGGGAESGNIVNLNCAGSGASNGQITFPSNETIYVVIKSGSYLGNLGTGGVNVTNVELGREP